MQRTIREEKRKEWNLKQRKKQLAKKREEKKEKKSKLH